MTCWRERKRVTESEALVKMRQSFKRVENSLMERASVGSKGKMTEKGTSQQQSAN